MPNNGVISRQANIAEEFKVTTTSIFNNSTDTIIVNKALTGNKVEQKAVNLNQLSGIVGGGQQGPQGPMGPQGPAGPIISAGLTWRGAFNITTEYESNDVVTWTNPSTGILGSYWVTALEGIIAVNPTDNSGNINTGWAFLASQGPQGIQGPAGPQGDVGPQGSPGSASLEFKEINLLLVFTSNHVINIIVGYSSFEGDVSVQSYWPQLPGTFDLQLPTSEGTPFSKGHASVSMSYTDDDYLYITNVNSSASIIQFNVFGTTKSSPSGWSLMYPTNVYMSVNIKVYN